jgi:hypothetical protein
MSILEQIIEEYPTAPYDWLALSLNPAISFQFINSHRSMPWNIAAVSRNPSITEAIVRSNLEFPWSYRDLCANPNISFDFMLEYAIKPTSRVDLDWNALSQNPMIEMDTIDRYSVYPWNDRYISINPNISSNYILNTGKNRSWVMAHISANPGITERDIYKNVLSWTHIHLSSNPNLPGKYLNDNQSYTWNMYSASANPNISFTDIDTFHAVPWDYSGLSLNPNITMNHVLNTSNKPWVVDHLLINPAITLDVVQSNPDYFYIHNAESYLCSNPTITTNWIKKNIRTVHWKRLSRNHFQSLKFIGDTIDF